MTMDELSRFLAWNTLIHFALLLTWAACFIFAHDWMLRMHQRYFQLSSMRFDELHYVAMGFYKIMILVFVFVPYLLVRLVLS